MRRDHVEDRLTGRLRVLLVGDELFVGRAVDGSVGAVGRHRGQALMAGDQGGIASAASGQHHQRLGTEVLKAPASAMELLAWANSSTKLRRLMPVATVARTPSLA